MKKVANKISVIKPSPNILSPLIMPELQPTPEFYQYQQKTTDYFDQYRRGSLKPWEETSKRKDIYRKIRFPKPGRWPGYLPGQGHATGYHYLDALPQGWYDYGMKAVEQRDWREVAKQALEAKPFFEKVEPHGMVFKKILGWGGYGLVALAEYRDELGNKIGNMVVKMNKRPEGRHAMTRERESHSVSRLSVSQGRAAVPIRALLYRYLPRFPNFAHELGFPPG